MKKKIIILIVFIAIIIAIITVSFIIINHKNVSPESILNKYISYINDKNYNGMYQLLDNTSKESISSEDFITRNKNIYEGIDLKNISIEIQSTEKVSNSKTNISYNTKMDTEAGDINFSNTVSLIKEGKEYKISWSSNLIFPNLNSDDKVRVQATSAKRGTITDRNNQLLAGEGEVSSVGLVPGKMSSNKESDIEKIAGLLDVTTDSINNALNASYVKEDTFVPIKKVAKDNQALKGQLLQIPGIMITTVNARVYPNASATSHLIGYIQNITAEELEKNPDKGYNANSVIGKAGLEKQYEDRLKGTDGIEVYIEDSNGNKKSTIVKKDAQDGENIKLTIDANIQNTLYNQLKNDKGLFVVMQPKTGEILALVSTPSYNANDFILGMGTNEWNSLTQDENKPMYNRFLQTWCPGSTFKPITGAIGLTSGKLSVNDEFSYSGLSWQKDSSWGDYYVTTLTSYSGPKNIQSALIHSDNIFFAQAALKIGKDTFEEGLGKIKFNENIGFDLPIYNSQFANDNSIDTDVGLADSGYGQGQILVNPIHMASIYSAFANDGNMVKPYLEYKEGKQVEYLVKDAFSKDAANTIKDDLIQVVENPEGTAHDAKMSGVTLAGKTGTAELKQTQDESGEIISWFDCFTENTDNPLLVISMVENARDDGGSHYLIQKIRSLF